MARGHGAGGAGAKQVAKGKLAMLTNQLRALFTGLLILGFSSAALGCQPQEPPGKANAPLALVDATALVKKTGAVAGDLKCEDFTLQESGAPQETAYSAGKNCLQPLPRLEMLKASP